jgi:hypothetical protein
LLKEQGEEFNKIYTNDRFLVQDMLDSLATAERQIKRYINKDEDE